MIRHLFLDKTNTIVEGSRYNMGLNPVLHLGYGKCLMRGLIHFNLDEIKSMVSDKTIANIDKMKCTLKMTNCLSVDTLKFNDLVNGKMQRAASFDLILFKLPCNFDEGRGYDNIGDFWYKDDKSVSKEGSSWFFAKSEIPWKYEASKYDIRGGVIPTVYDRATADHYTEELINLAKTLQTDTDDFETCNWNEVKQIIVTFAREKTLGSDDALKGGIYDNETLINEYEKFEDGKRSIIVGVQHFDFGNENLSIDITNYVKDLLKHNVDYNYGLGLAFAPRFEASETELEQYVGFFTNHTNTFFHPYVEVDYQEYISDDRESFTLGKDNNLYLYVYDDDIPTNLDMIPSCSINGVNFQVKQATKGVYFAHIPKNSIDLDAAAIYTDKWSQIVLNGVQEDDIELEFSTRPREHRISIGEKSVEQSEYVPFVYGINDKENVKQGDVRTVYVDFKKKYSTEIRELNNNAEYRLYIKDGGREYVVFDYQPLEKSFLNNYFIINTNDLVPNEYYVDIKVKKDRNVKNFNKVLKFRVSDDITERYQ